MNNNDAPKPKQFYVYTLSKPDGSVFYIGKGKGLRIGDHEREARRGHICYKCNTIRKIWSEGGAIIKKIVFETDNEQDAFAKEIELIEAHDTSTLCNMTLGGEGRTLSLPIQLERESMKIMAEQEERAAKYYKKTGKQPRELRKLQPKPCRKWH